MKNEILFMILLIFCISSLQAQITFQQAKDSLSILEGEILNILETENDLPESIQMQALKDLRALDQLKQQLPGKKPNDGIATNAAISGSFDSVITSYNDLIGNLDIRAQKEHVITQYLDELTVDVKEKDNYITDDIYNPINFTTIIHRRPAENGYVTSISLLNRASRHFIKKEGTLHLEFDKKFVKYLTFAGKLDIRVKAFIERKDKTVKPLSVLGLTDVKANKTSDKSQIINKSDSLPIITDSYGITYLNSGLETISAEIAVPFEDVSIDETIIVEITNQKINGVGFISKFVFAEYGWSQGATGGFTFVQTIDGDDHIYRAAGSAGYAFRYDPKPSASFWRHFFSPSFGPELNVLQKDDTTLMGLGLFASSFSNAVKVGSGFYINGESNKMYVAIGLNFIEGYNKISELLNRVE